MTLPTLLRRYAAYNNWANHRLMEWLQANPADLFTREMPSSFSSLRATILHIWGAQDIWLRRLQGESPMQFITAGFAGSDAEAVELFLQHSQTLADFVAACPDAFFEEKTTYTHRTGAVYQQENAEMLFHAFQHGTYHRGQIVTIARNFGLTDPPQTDYILYVLNRVDLAG